MTRRQPVLFIFFMGLILGIAGALLVPKYLGPYMPETIGGKEATVKGEVLGKQKKGEALLLTVNTEQGAVLVSFLKQADEVDLLVGENDKIEFALDTYKPFIEDPTIIRVQKSEQAPKAAEAPGKPSGPGTPETKRQPAAKPAPRSPASKSTSTVSPTGPGG